MLPFSREEFLAVFESYNEAIWPIQAAAYLFGIVAVTLLFHPSRVSDRIIAAILSGMWLWTGIAYHAMFFATINRAAFAFGALFVVQGLGFALAGVLRNQLRFGYQMRLAGWVGVILILYSTIAYPLIGMVAGHAFPGMPMFGVTPCPITLFTFGLLLLTTERFTSWLLVIPFVWSLIGGSAALLLSIPQDWLLLISGLIAVPLIAFRDHSSPRVAKAN